MDNADNVIGKAYSNLLYVFLFLFLRILTRLFYRMNTFGTPTCGEIFSQSMLAYIPTCIREFLADHVPSHKLLYARTTGKLATGVAKSLVNSRVDALLHGNRNRDIMSLLGKFACIS
jgi:hypothetical protein